MIPDKETFSFQKSMNYLAGLTFRAAKGGKALPGIGFIFGNPNLPQFCQQFCETGFKDNDIRLVLLAGQVTGTVRLESAETGKLIVSGIVNIVRSELEAFSKETADDAKCVLVFGFRSGCDFILVPSGKKEEYRAVVLHSFQITIENPDVKAED